MLRSQVFATILGGWEVGGITVAFDYDDVEGWIVDLWCINHWTRTIVVSVAEDRTNPGGRDYSATCAPRLSGGDDGNGRYFTAIPTGQRKRFPVRINDSGIPVIEGWAVQTALI